MEKREGICEIEEDVALTDSKHSPHDRCTQLTDVEFLRELAEHRGIAGSVFFDNRNLRKVQEGSETYHPEIILGQRFFPLNRVDSFGISQCRLAANEKKELT